MRTVFQELPASASKPVEHGKKVQINNDLPWPRYKYFIFSYQHHQLFNRCSTMYGSTNKSKWTNHNEPFLWFGCSAISNIWFRENQFINLDHKQTHYASTFWNRNQVQSPKSHTSKLKNPTESIEKPLNKTCRYLRQRSYMTLRNATDAPSRINFITYSYKMRKYVGLKNQIA